MGVEIDLQYHFTDKKPHLLIRRLTPQDVYIDIYAKNDDAFQRVLSHEQWIFTYVNDTIRDINGDNRRDFVVNGYGSSGCCLKAFSDVYLFNDDETTFTDGFEFINPTFSPAEHIIRGVCYGHPGETELYKYKWNGMQVDTIEYVFFEKDILNPEIRKVIISNNLPYSGNQNVLKRLNDVPEEYKEIVGYDWFMGDIR
ncbi:MAG: hypothetical protein LUH10_16615 [Tannerellaceae bacterium]|nr:hypothetical protein [Tannerellaceae bacterium]